MTVLSKSLQAILLCNQLRTTLQGQCPTAVGALGNMLRSWQHLANSSPVLYSGKELENSPHIIISYI